MPTTLSILVYVASPLDFARYRHTALYFQFPAETASEADLKSSLMEIVGSHGFFTFSERVNWDIPIHSTGVERDWNCQNWVGDVLARLVATDYLDSAERNRGLDGMVDAILEAKDEDIT
ncbi:uncharacterized protein PFLUO_LOCUS676 [Penicillium psychrofluorescens]|uniref:uncharacterized protein n=1 Tax=Penicillium psychrofluorescens TaxID=3158075 RepID=UPI003CCE38A4